MPHGSAVEPYAGTAHVAEELLLGYIYISCGGVAAGGELETYLYITCCLETGRGFVEDRLGIFSHRQLDNEQEEEEKDFFHFILMN